MPNSRLEFKIENNASFRAAIRALGKVEKVTTAQLGKQYWAEGKILAKEASYRILEEPTHGFKHTGIRQEISDGVHVEGLNEGDYTGVLITTSVPQEDEAIIPSGFDTDRGWRHPVFAPRDDPKPWVAQKGEFSWFASTMREAFPRLITMTCETLEEAAKVVAEATKI